MGHVYFLPAFYTEWYIIRFQEDVLQYADRKALGV
jgi:hypothetical protein